MHRRTLSILLPLALALAALTALAAPAATPTAWFTANLPTPVAPETVTPLEQALLERIAGAATSIDAAFYDFDRPAIRDALIA